MATPPTRGTGWSSASLLLGWARADLRNTFRTHGVRSNENRKETDPRKSNEYNELPHAYCSLARWGSTVAVDCSPRILTTRATPIGPFVVLFKCLASPMAGLEDEMPVRIKRFQQPRERRNIAGVHLPAAFEALDDPGRRRLAWSNVEDRTASRHDPVSLTRDDGPAGLRQLGHQAKVAFRKAGPQLRAGGVRREYCVEDAVCLRQRLSICSATAAAAGKYKSEARVIRVLFYDAGNGIDIMGAAEVARIVYDERPVWERQWGDLCAIRPILGNVNFVLRYVSCNEPRLHVVVPSTMMPSALRRDQSASAPMTQVSMEWGLRAPRSTAMSG